MIAVREKEKSARSARDRCRSDLDNAKSAVQSSESQVSSLASEINRLALDIQRLEQKRQEIHKKRGEIGKAAIPVLQNSTQFWLLFKQLSEDAENCSTLLTKIVNKAHERRTYEILQSNGGQRTTITFEAWESMGVAAADGYSNHMFSIDYTCVKCKSTWIGFYLFYLQLELESIDR